MEKAKSLRILGFGFLANSAAFLAIGLTTKLTSLATLAPAFMTLGIVFLVMSRSRHK